MLLDESVRVFGADYRAERGVISQAYAMANQNPKFGHRFIGLESGSHMNPRQIPHLQAADFAAYYLTKARRDPSNAIARSMNAILQPQHVEYVGTLQAMRAYL